MAVRKLVQPDMTTQSAAVYKAAIENAIAAMAEVANMFAPSETSPAPNMSVQIGAGSNAIGAAVAAASVGPIGAPAVNPRIDRIYYDTNAGTFGRTLGAEAAVPAPPAAPFGSFLICDVHLYVGMTQITNNDLTDIRSMLFSGPAFANGGYTNIVDPDGFFKILIGRGGIDHRIILRTHTNAGGGSKVEYQDASGAVIATIHDTGLIQGKTYTVGTLPAAGAGLINARSFVTDATQTLTAGIGAVVAGGGANPVPVICDGVSWRIG